MKSNRTPGPWFNVGDTDIRANQANQNGDHVATIWSVGEVETKANARLIAAAPELLDIAEQAVAAFNFLSIKAASHEDRQEFIRRETAARAVIAKAIGP